MGWLGGGDGSPRSRGIYLLGWDARLQLAILIGAIACADSAAGNGLEESPTWRVLTFFALFLVLSIVVELVMHHSKHFCEHKGWIGVLHAIHKIEEELMLLGFISLMLLVVEEYIADICIADDPFWKGIKCEAHVQGHGNAPAPAPAYAAAPKSGLSPPSYDSTYTPSYGRRLLESTGSSRRLLESTGSSRRLLADGPSHDCSDGKAPILEINAMHQVHLLIFLIACFHVTFSLSTLLISKARINHWTGWEFWGDDPTETVERLKPPQVYTSSAKKFVVMFCNQFVQTVDPFSYIAFRRYYISKMELPDSFIFKDRVMRSLQNDFKSVVGVSPWMWVILTLQLLLEGYHWGKYYIMAIISIVLVLSAGTKMLYISHRISLGIMKIYDEEADGKIEQSDLDRIQKEGQSSAKLEGLEAGFWFGSPKFLMQCIRFALFSSAVTVAEAVFYRWQVGANACFFKDRSGDPDQVTHMSVDDGYGFPTVVVIMSVISVLNVLLLGFVLVPLYSVVNTSGHHSIDKGAIEHMFAAHHHHGTHPHDGGHGDHGHGHGDGHGEHDHGGHDNHHVAPVAAKVEEAMHGHEPLPPIKASQVAITPPE